MDAPEVASGLAIGTEPADGTAVPAGSAVTLLVSGTATDGLVDVPSVVGRPQADAEQALFDAGLVPAVALQGAPAEQAGLVIAQDPPDGQVEPGSTVSLVVGEESTATDAGPEGSPDGSTDVGAEGAADGGTDAGADEGTDTGTDAGAGTDADAGAVVP